MVRYFSPNPYTQDWDDFDWFKVCYYLFSQLPDNADEHAIQNLLEPLAPNLTFSVSSNDEHRELIGQSADYQYRRHHGGGTNLMPEYKQFYSELIVCDDTPQTPQAGIAYAYPAAEGLCLHLPVAERPEVFSETDTDELLQSARDNWTQTLNNYCNDTPDVTQCSMGLFKDEKFRMADILTRWNYVRHFYPHLEYDTQDWDAQLPLMLERMRTLPITEDQSVRMAFWLYQKTVQELLNPIRDSHINIRGTVILSDTLGGHISYFYLPIQPDIVDNHIIIRAVSPQCTADIPTGSTIETVNGFDAFKALEEKLIYVNSSNRQTALYRALRELFSSPEEGTAFTLGYRTPEGICAETTLTTSEVSLYFDPSTIEGPFIRFTDDNIAVIDPCQRSATYKEFAENLDKIRAARGVVFNLRGYPMYDFTNVLCHLTDTPLSISFIHTPIYCFPNQQYVTYQKANGQLPPVAPKIDVPVVFLCNHDAMSWAETVLMMVDGYDLGTIVGTPSCGTNGDVSLYWLPVYDFFMTTNYATNIDGSRHHGIGVVPDIEAVGTFEGYRAGRDEVLEAGLDYIRNQK